MKQLPKKITPDAIREALFEMRFEHDELAEVIVGKLAGRAEWSGFAAQRLASGTLPDELRQSDVALRYLPSVELRHPGGGELVRVGPQMCSHHILGEYVGWAKFSAKLAETAAAVVSVAPSLRLTRLGLRYINALTSTEHFISSVYDLNISIKVAGDNPSPTVVLGYEIDAPNGMAGVVKIVSPRFVEGPVPSSTVAVVDIDIFSENRFEADVGAIQQWLNLAHGIEKEAFFSLLRDETVQRLMEN